jgi:hypothetical protein
VDERAIEGQFGRASLACLLNFIGGWLHVGALCLVAFTLFLMWCGVREGLNLFAVLAGLVGIGHWLTSGTGLGFLVSGPRAKGALGLSIATASTGGFHLMLLIVIATSRYDGGFGSVGTSRTAELHWEAFVTQAGAIPLLLFLVIGYSEFFDRLSDGSVLPVLACLFEIGRMILLLLTLRAVMLNARDTRGASTCMRGVVGYSIGAGSLVVLAVLFGVLLLLARPANPARGGGLESLSAIFFLFIIVVHLVLAGLGVGTTLIIKSVKSKIDYRR